MVSDAHDLAFYGDLSPWWPLISPLEEYEEEASFIAQILAELAPPSPEVLELGSGGGHCAHHLKRACSMTLVDLSEGMLEVSKRLNSDCEHLLGDMRTLRLGRTFDVVFVHDAIDYMTTELDLRAVFDTAAAHLRAGGLALFLPDDLRDTFEAGSGSGGSDAADGRGARYLEWSWDPDPSDTWVQTEYAFVLREADGSVHSVHESHRTGLFPRAFWIEALEDAGFAVEVRDGIDAREQGESHSRQLFVATLR